MEKIYFQKDATPKLLGIIKSFWLIDKKKDIRTFREKVIPDGYPELIFHYGDFFKTNIDGQWRNQKVDLIAGQIKNHFFLENTGITKVFGIKLQPWALNELFNIEMHHLTDQVIEIPIDLLEILIPLKKISISSLSFEKKVMKIEDWFIKFLSYLNFKRTKGQKAIELIIQNKGQFELSRIQNEVGISERGLERYFKTKIGLPPKYYSRIIRFSNIFKLIQGDDIDWADILFLTGFYDQSHFIKNFKEFTGEDPSRYSFFEKNLANLFLKK